MARPRTQPETVTLNYQLSLKVCDGYKLRELQRLIRDRLEDNEHIERVIAKRVMPVQVKKDIRGKARLPRAKSSGAIPRQESCGG